MSTKTRLLRLEKDNAPNSWPLFFIATKEDEERYDAWREENRGAIEKARGRGHTFFCVSFLDADDNALPRSQTGWD